MNYQSIKVRPERRGRCPVCGKSSVRSRVFEQTLNPFNRNPDGSAKTAREVFRAVDAEAAAWVPDFTHVRCAEVKS